MDNKTEERLLNVFSEASGKSAGGAHASDAARRPPATEDRSHADSVAEYTSGPAEASSFDASLDGGAGESYHGTSGSASSSAAAAAAEWQHDRVGGWKRVRRGAMGLVPLVGSLFGLFDSKSTQPPVFQKYEMPSPISFEAADTPSGLANADYGQMGLPRLYDSSDADRSLRRKWSKQWLGGHQRLRGLQRARSLQ